jgi:hypothetical protein
MNFLKETIDMVHFHGRTADEVLWVGDLLKSCDWDEFKKKADFEYPDRGINAYINPFLKIVGKDWWLCRMHYYESEWWSYRTHPKIPLGKNVTLEHKEITPLPCTWISLEEKLPPTNEWVLVSTIGYGKHIMEFDEDGKWRMNVPGLPRPVDYVTHWMLLPEKPNEN